MHTKVIDIYAIIELSIFVQAQLQWGIVHPLKRKMSPAALEAGDISSGYNAKHNRKDVLSMKLKRIVSAIIASVMILTLLPMNVSASKKGITLSKSSITLEVGKSATLTKTVTGYKNYTVQWSSSNKEVATVSKGKVTAKKAGTATITAKIKGTNYKATCKVTVKKKSAKVSEPVFASRTMPEDYSTEPVPFKEKIDSFNKQVKEVPVPSEDKQTYNAYNNDSFLVKKLEIDGIPLYEIKRKDSEPKPLVIVLHGGGWHKDLDYAAGMSMDKNVCMVAIDCAGSGESQDGPIQAPAAFMETVKDIDTLIEYYNTVSDVDATKFGIMGHSMGGNIAMYYVLYGKYKPTAINVMNSSADLTDEGPKWDCFDKGKNGQTPIWTEEQLKSFSAATAPLNHPEYFKDIWVYACCGELDDVHFPATVEKLKKAVEDLGGKKFVYHLYKGVGHDTPQSWVNKEQKEFFSRLTA